MVFLYKKRQKQFYSNCVVYSYAAFSSFGVSVGSSISTFRGILAFYSKWYVHVVNFTLIQSLHDIDAYGVCDFGSTMSENKFSAAAFALHTTLAGSWLRLFARFCGGNAFDCIEGSCKSCYIRHFVVDVCSIRRVTSVIKLYSHIYIAEAICYAPWQWLW